MVAYLLMGISSLTSILQIIVYILVIAVCIKYLRQK